MTSPIIQKLAKECEKLNEAQQLQVLHFAKSIKEPENKISSGNDLLPLVGTISEEDADLMEKAIKKSEKVDLSEW